MMSIFRYIPFLMLNFTVFNTLVAYDQMAVEIRENPSCAANSLFFVSFPRSGSHWLKTILQVIEGYPIYPLCGTYSLENPHNLSLDLSKRRLYIMHEPHWIDGVSSINNCLLVIVRDYKECFVRQAKSYEEPVDIETVADLGFNQQTYSDLYLDILRLYDSWDVENRYLIYYEDLIQFPHQTLTKLFQFIGGEQERVDSFIENLEYYKRISIEHYNIIEGVHGGSMSSGQSANFHTQNYSNDELQHLDQLMKSRAGDLWNKYLRHYSKDH